MHLSNVLISSLLRAREFGRLLLGTSLLAFVTPATIFYHRLAGWQFLFLFYRVGLAETGGPTCFLCFLFLGLCFPLKPGANKIGSIWHDPFTARPVP